MSGAKHKMPQGHRDAPMQVSPEGQSPSCQHRLGGGMSTQVPSPPVVHISPSQRAARPTGLEQVESS